MEKLREFWIEPNEEFFVVAKPSKEDGLQKFIHVREVSLELDAAYLECEKALEKVECESIINYEGSGMFNKHDPECCKCKTLAALNEAKG